MRILLIDDEPFYFTLIRKVLKESEYQLEYAKSGQEGIALISSFDPELLIVDLVLPDMEGFEILGRLRKSPKYSHIPVIVVTAKDKLNEKLKAFEMGADDYLVKPFQPEELEARIALLARRGKEVKYLQALNRGIGHDEANLITTHSLRGGLGCTSIVLNLGLALYKIWEKPTVLVDGVLAAGQVALMLDAKPKITWDNIVGANAETLDDSVVGELIIAHESGIQFIASPKTPIAGDSFTPETIHLFIEKLKNRTEFIVADVSHDFSDMTIQMLLMSDTILLVMAPEVASMRAALSALEIYDHLEIPPDKVKLILNHNSSNPSIKRMQIEKIMKRAPDFILPFEPTEVHRAINLGKPFLLTSPNLPVCVELEKIAYQLSGESHKAIPPPIPTASWKRVTGNQSGK
jgi:pilus assembly protein CpaE